MLVIDPDVEHRSEDFDLDPEVVRAVWRMETAHFWFPSRNAWIARALERAGVAPAARVLDVGCGSGAVAAALAARGHPVVGVDTAEVLVRKAHERCPRATFVATAIARLDPALGPFDVVGFFDVLEHLDDPLALMRDAIAHARPGALVVATVPGVAALWSALDVLYGHKRRYDAGQLARTFAAAGLADVAEHGLFRLLLPLMRVRRAHSTVPGDLEAQRRLILADLRVPAAPVDALLRLACRLEARLGFEAARGRPGPTLLATGRVPGGRATGTGGPW